MNPSTDVDVGEQVNLTCTLTYNAPSMDAIAPFPLSVDQDPELSMFIGQTKVDKEMAGEKVVDGDTVPHSKSLVSNNLSEGELQQCLHVFTGCVHRSVRPF